MLKDMKGDLLARKAKTLPILIGEANARKAASLIYLLFVPLTALPFFTGLNANLLSVLLVIIADLGIIKLAFQVLNKNDSKTLKEARKNSFFFLFVGLLGLLFGVYTVI